MPWPRYYLPTPRPAPTLDLPLLRSTSIPRPAPTHLPARVPMAAPAPRPSPYFQPRGPSLSPGRGPQRPRRGPTAGLHHRLSDLARLRGHAPLGVSHFAVCGWGEGPIPAPALSLGPSPTPALSLGPIPTPALSRGPIPTSALSLALPVPWSPSPECPRSFPPSPVPPLPLVPRVLLVPPTSALTPTYQDGRLRAYGAGLVSSFGELSYCLSKEKVHTIPGCGVAAVLEGLGFGPGRSAESGGQLDTP